MESLEERVKKHEGFRNTVYRDTLDKRTVGYGHLCVEDFWKDNKEYDEEFLTSILKDDLKNAVEGAERLLKNCSILHNQAKEIIIEMVFQLGETGVSKFKNMLKALELEGGPDYEVASIEMLDSRWAKQTPNRAKELSNIMGGII